MGNKLCSHRLFPMLRIFLALVFVKFQTTSSGLPYVDADQEGECPGWELYLKCACDLVPSPLTAATCSKCVDEGVIPQPPHPTAINACVKEGTPSYYCGYCHFKSKR